MKIRAMALMILGAPLILPAAAAPPGTDQLMELLVQGLDRETSQLKGQEMPPYHLALRVDEVRQGTVSASLGVLTGSLQDRSRTLNVQVRVGERILPEHFQVVCDPTLRTRDGEELVGHYRFDDEGVAAEPVSLVRRGVLQGFLMSRSPIQGFLRSNGHGRAEMGYPPVSRQSNLIVTSSRPLAPADLRARLRAECRKQGKPFGLRFEEVSGGFTLTGRFLPNAFNVLPLEVYRVFLDGRPDELVRGVDLVGTPLVMLSQIRDAGSERGVFSGFCGAESGMVPVACAAPALLVTQVEVQKRDKAQDKPPLLARPTN